VALALFSGYNFTNEIIARALAAPLREMDEECSFAKSLKSVMMNKRKMPIGRDITTKVKVLKKEFNLTSRVNDGGKDIKEYKYLTEEEYEAKMKKEAVEDESGVDGVAEVSDDEVEVEWLPGDIMNGETCMNCLKRNIIKFIADGNSNEFRTAAEWLKITGLCGFKNKTVHHHAIMTYLVKEGFIKRCDNKLCLVK
jgi:hypothetical protein